METQQEITKTLEAQTQTAANDIETTAPGKLRVIKRNGKVVAGAGGSEIELSRNIRHFANSLSGREQLAVIAFADAMEIIPKTLAENAGLDPIDILTEMKSLHDKGKKWAGMDVFNGKVIDAWEAGIIEPLKIKTQAVSSASEVASMILRIDDVISTSSGKDNMPGPDMGGMPPMM